jgi:hypothetical protein
MSELILDPIELAKTFQFEISLIDDPIEAAFKGSEAYATLSLIDDERLRPGAPLVLRAIGGYALHQWDQDEARYRSFRYDQFVANGESRGLVFMQNLNSIVLALRSSRIFEHGPEGQLVSSECIIDALAVPVAGIDEIKMAA